MFRCRQKGIDNDCAVARSGQCVTRKSCAVLKFGWGSHEHVQGAFVPNVLSSVGFLM